MDKPINGDKYIRTLSHYLRSNQRRLLPPTLAPPQEAPENATKATSVASVAAANARPFLTPGDPMAAAYQGMVSSLWNATSAVVNSIAPASLIGDDSKPRGADRDIYNGSWDGTSAILPDSNPAEIQLYQQAQLRAPIFPLDLYYLLYLLERFEQVGIEFEGWEGTTSSTVGDSKPRVIPSAGQGAKTGSGILNPASNLLFPPSKIPTTGGGGTGTAGAGGEASTRPQSIRSFSSTAVSTLTLITGWKQWSTAASFNSSSLTVTDDIHFIRKFLKHVPSLRLVAKIPPGDHIRGKGRIEGFNADTILTLLNHGQSLETDGEATNNKKSLLLLPLSATFPALTHLELHKIPPDCIEGWETLMKQLRSLVIIQSGIEDVYDVIVTAVVKSEKRRRLRVLRENSRAVQIKEEQQEALKDAALTSQELGYSVTAERGDSSGDGNGSNGSVTLAQGREIEEDDAIILSSLKMWPVLRHLSLSDNSFPSLAHNDTFSHTQSVTSLDLSHNLFLSPPSGLIHLHNLNQLNLSYNMISGVQSIYQILGNISVLDLRGNRLESLSGLERLWNLEKVDVRENHLDEAAEVGRLAALPGIREVWSERNPFCAIQPKYRLEILVVFKANGHDLLLDGSFASFVEKRALANMSPSSFSTTISSINNVANIPAASAPVATFAQELSQGHDNHNHLLSQSVAEEALNAATSPGVGPNAPINKLVKKKLVKSTKRVKRVVNLDSDHEDEHHSLAHADVDVKDLDALHDDEVAAITAKTSGAALGPSAGVKEKKKKKKKSTKSTSWPTSESPGQAEENGQAVDNASSNGRNGHGKGDEKESIKVKKRATKKNTGVSSVSFAGDEAQEQHDSNEDHTLCKDGHHVHRHRLASLERSMTSLQLERSGNSVGAGVHSTSAHQHEPSRKILKKTRTMPMNSAVSPRLRPSSPIGSFSSDDGGADGYRRKIEAMRNEAGKNWLMVLAEMDGDSTQGQ
ncbi:hypothetical protein BC939DRAFT_462314 [Gamsiella multidivaricata]|uniref:uncharacterized protein n=1 Tax=Gamsiella multidivaricata TaxID=101098 RepID=UPI00222013BA|nr:uncharacterized protein BC939DRAFT_462314 [Gamsiella multidivaricata]KAG0367487.1 hypothetical protein BGZ54_003780 [Gamsiella multidivaricata]KAI7818629.1 hypothetical protein BC939DRAFT_462314 [Gamsiella multidivaricata]